ncbi:MAG: N-acetyl-gamma-glutamyl-phosphate reductase [bacterium]|nr:N-acetyl-gamma-glutamyl-phosphate reductase [bacterium]
MTRVAIVGATGYTGSELLDILIGHPRVAVTSLTAKLDAPVPVGTELPRFAGRVDLPCTPLDPDEVCEKADVVFLSLPHGVSMAYAETFLSRGKKVIDLSADFRFGDRALYERWYGIPHRAAGRLGEAVYGLPELHEAEIRGTSLVANPGCYPTGAILAVAPLLARGAAGAEGIVIDSKSGVTGAGRRASLALSFGECHESFRAYKIGSHQHTPEIEAELGRVAGRPVTVLFAPHLVPMNRGILTTAYLAPRSAISTDDLLDLYREFYAAAPFVRVMDGGALPDTKNVLGLNYCDLSVVADERAGRIVAVSAIDNLVKGAAGQAVQNMNLVCGFPQTDGLV